MIELDAKCTPHTRKEMVELTYGTATDNDFNRLTRILGKRCVELGACYDRNVEGKACTKCCINGLLNRSATATAAFKQCHMTCEECDNPCGGIKRLIELDEEGKL